MSFDDLPLPKTAAAMAEMAAMMELENEDEYRPMSTTKMGYNSGGVSGFGREAYESDEAYEAALAAEAALEPTKADKAIKSNTSTLSKTLTSDISPSHENSMQLQDSHDNDEPALESEPMDVESSSTNLNVPNMNTEIIPASVKEENDPPLQRGEYNLTDIPASVEIQYELPSGPLVNHLSSKEWKIRNLALDELRKRVVSDVCDASFYEEYGTVLMRMLSTESNPSVLDAILDVLTMLISTADSSTANLLSSQATAVEGGCLSIIIDKGFTAARAATATRARGLVLLLMETSESTTSIVTVLLGKITDRRPKLPPAVLETITSGIISFGANNFPIKEILKSIPPVFQSSAAAVRDAGMNLIVTIALWIGQDPMISLLESLRPAQKTDFDRLLSSTTSANNGNPPTPTIWMRKDRIRCPETGQMVPPNTIPSTLGGSNIVIAHNNNSNTDLAREYVDEVDLFRALKGTDWASALAEEKWQEQVRGIGLIITAIGPIPRLKNSSIIHEIMTAIAPILRGPGIGGGGTGAGGSSAGSGTGGHVAVQMKALKLVALMADGLRKPFGVEIRALMGSILGKTREKKLASDVSAVADVVFRHCLSFDNFVEDIDEALGSGKRTPPATKICLTEICIGVIKMSISGISCSMPSILGDSTRRLFGRFVSNSDDPDPGVRSISVSALAALVSTAMNGAKFEKEISDLSRNLCVNNPKLHKRIMESVATLASPTVKTPAPAPSTSSGQINHPSGGGTILNRTVSKSTTSTSSTTNIRKNVTNSIPGKGCAAFDDGGDLETETVTLSIDDATDALRLLAIPEWSILGDQLSSPKWGERVDALALITSTLQRPAPGDGDGITPEAAHSLTPSLLAALYTYLYHHTNGLKITNINVMKSVLDLFVAAFQSMNHCGQRLVSGQRGVLGSILDVFGDKFGDKKLSTSLENLLVEACNVAGKGFTIRKLVSVVEKAKAPMVKAGFFQWFNTVIDTIGLAELPVLVVVGFAVCECENKALAVRTSAVETTGVLYHRIGPQMVSVALTKDTPQVVRSLLETEFSKVGFNPSAAISGSTFNSNNHNSSVPTVTMGNSSGVGSGTSITASLFPRKDLFEVVDKSLLIDLAAIEGKDSWQVRKAALERLTTGLANCGHHLEWSKPVGELLRILRQRLNDTQSNLKPLAVNAVATVLTSLELPTAIRMTKQYGPAMIAAVGDNKKAMRDAAIAALESVVTRCGQGPPSAPLLLSLATGCGETLASVTGRLELLTWFNTHGVIFASGAAAGMTDCSDLVSPLVSALQDKNNSVRISADTFVTHLVTGGHITKTALEKALRSLPPAAIRSLQPVIDRFAVIRPVSSSIPISAGGDSSNISKSRLTPHHDVEISQVPPGKVITSETLKAAGYGSPVKHSVVASSNATAVAPVNSCAPTSKTPHLITLVPPPGGGNLLQPIGGKLERVRAAIRDPTTYAATLLEWNALRGAWTPFLAVSVAHALFVEIHLPSIPTLIDDLSSDPSFLSHTDLFLQWVRHMAHKKPLPHPHALSICLDIAHAILAGVCRQIAVSSSESVSGSQGWRLEPQELQLFLTHFLYRLPLFSPTDVTTLTTISRLLASGSPGVPLYGLVNVLVEALVYNVQARTFSLRELAAIIDSSGTSSLGTREVRILLETISSIALANTGDVNGSLAMDENSEWNAACMALKCLLITTQYDLDVLSNMAGKEVDVLSVLTAFHLVAEPSQQSSGGINSAIGGSPGIVDNGGSSLIETLSDLAGRCSELSTSDSLGRTLRFELLDHCRRLLRPSSSFSLMAGIQWSASLENLLIRLGHLLLSNFGLETATAALGGDATARSTLAAVVAVSAEFIVVVDNLAMAGSEVVFSILTGGITVMNTLSNSSTQALSNGVGTTELLHAVNLLLTRAAQRFAYNDVLIALLRLMVTSEAAYGRLASRLSLVVLTAETAKKTPFHGGVGISSFLRTANALLTGISTRVGGDGEAPLTIRVVKTVVSTFLRSTDEHRVLTALTESGVPLESIISRLVLSLLSSPAGIDSLTVNSILSSTYASDGNSTLPSELESQVTYLVEELSSQSAGLRDREATISRLYRLRRDFPTIRLDGFLHTLSAAYRRFVLDSLDKLESADRSANAAAIAGVLPTVTSISSKVTSSTTPQAVPSTVLPMRFSTSINSGAIPNIPISSGFGMDRSTPHTVGHSNISSMGTSNIVDDNMILDDEPSVEVGVAEAQEALRIIEALKSKPPPFRSGDSTPLSTPFGSGFDSIEVEERSILLSSSPRASSGTVTATGSPRVAPSPFSARNDRIRDSLSSLTRSLDLPRFADAGKYSATDALESRLQRLKNIQR